LTQVKVYLLQTNTFAFTGCLQLFPLPMQSFPRDLASLNQPSHTLYIIPSAFPSSLLGDYQILEQSLIPLWVLLPGRKMGGDRVKSSCQREAENQLDFEMMC